MKKFLLIILIGIMAYVPFAFALDNTHSIILNGSSQYAYNTNTALNLTGAFTYMVWFYPVEVANYPFLIGDSLVNNSIGETTIYIDGSNSHLTCRTWSGAGFLDVDAGAVTLSAWNFAAWVKHADNSWDCFLGTTTTLTSVHSGASRTLSNTNKQGIVIGAAFEGSASDWLHGYIDEARLYNTDMVTSAIQAVYNCQTVVSTSLLGYWKFNNGYTDDSGNGYTLTAVNSPIFSTTNTPFANNCGGVAATTVSRPMIIFE